MPFILAGLKLGIGRGLIGVVVAELFGSRAGLGRLISQSADAFNMPMQELVTEYCWGAVWGRENLPHKTRSMLNLAMIATLNRPHELKMHIRGALTNGVSKDEIREIFMQVAIYAGVPAGVDAFRIAREVFDAEDKAKAGESSPK